MPVHRTPLAALAAATVTTPLLWTVPAAAGGGEPQYTIRTIARTGDAAPGLFAGTYESFWLPFISANGQVSFAARTTGTVVSSGHWGTPYAYPQSLQLIVGEDLLVPGAPIDKRFGAINGVMSHALTIDDGTVGLWAGLDGYADPDAGGLFTMDAAGTLEAVALPGDSVNGIPGTTFAEFGRGPSLSAGGLLVFEATIEGPGIDDGNNEGIFVEWFGGITPLAREGGAVPGMPEFTWKPYGFGGAQIAPNGRVAFNASIDVGDDLHWSLWSGFPGALDPIAIEGDPAPGGGTFASTGAVVDHLIGGDDHILMRAAVQDGGAFRRGLWLADSGDIDLIAREGIGGPIGDWINVQADRAMIDAENVVVFNGRGTGDSASDSGLFRYRVGDGVQAIMLEGHAAPGMGPGVTFNDVGGPNVAFTIDDRGRVFFAATVAGDGVDPSNDFGLWVVEPNGTTNLLLRQGDPVDVEFDQPLELRSFEFRTVNGSQTGRRAGANARGDLAIRLGFDDDAEAIVVLQRRDACPVDRNDDGIIDFDDLLIVLANFSVPNPIGEGGDADWDGDTDFDDLLLLLVSFGQPCFPV